jgi:hypothetical protein
LTAGASAGTARTVTHTGVLLHGLTLLASGGLPRMVARDVAVLAERVAGATAGLLQHRRNWLPTAVLALDTTGPVGVLAPAQRLGSAHWSALVLRTTAGRAADSVESADWLHGHAHLTAVGTGLDYRALVLLGSPADRRVLDLLGDRGVSVVAAGAGTAVQAVVGRAGAVVAVDVDGDDDTDVARLSESCVAELVAASL